MRSPTLAKGLVIGMTVVLGACGEDCTSPPPSYMDECNSDTDCHAALICAAPVLITKVCTLSCRADMDCPDGSVCASDVKLCDEAFSF
jgi:hypothetical protein